MFLILFLGTLQRNLKSAPVFVSFKSRLLLGILTYLFPYCFLLFGCKLGVDTNNSDVS